MAVSAGALFVRPGSPVRAFADAVSWLWRLGPVQDAPNPQSVGLGCQEEAVELHGLLRSGALSGAAVFAGHPGLADGPVPGRAPHVGVASFGPACRVSGAFAVLDGGGQPVVCSSAGIHAVRDEAWMVLGADPGARWGALDSFWVFSALADFLVEVLDRPILMLPPVGWVRYDDVPGTAYHQLLGRAKPDSKVRRRVERVTNRFAEVGARLNVAIAPRALRDGGEVAVDEIWPRAIDAIGDGMRHGHLEPVCHGYLHLDTDAWERGEVSPFEFADVGREEAARRLEVALDWFAGRFGDAPHTFVAPAWAYGEGLLAALAERQVSTWLPPVPAALVAANTARETVFSRMEGLVGLNYGPFRALANAGLPPSVVVHGGLFDSRAKALLDPRHGLTTIRLARKRDLFRAPWVEGVRWIGASELVDRMRAHDRIVASDMGVLGPVGAEVIVRDRAGSRMVTIEKEPQ